MLALACLRPPPPPRQHWQAGHCRRRPALTLEPNFLLPVRAGNGQQQQQEQLQSQSAITAYDNMLQDKERVIRE